MYRFVEQQRPTLLIDEVDGVFNKAKDPGTEDIRKILNSGYRAGKKVLRMGGRNNTEVQFFDPFCPKALAGLNKLPATLTHRSISIAMKPPLPTDRYEDDFDIEDVEEQAAPLRARFQAWAESGPPLRDKDRRPQKLGGLDGRTNDNWRILLRIADLAGVHWPETARAAALALNKTDGAGVDDSESYALRALSDIRDLYRGQNMDVKALVETLNADDDLPWGGWSKGLGVSVRSLGKLLRDYGIRRQTIKVDGRPTHGYRKDALEDAFSRYLPFYAAPHGTPGFPSQKQAVFFAAPFAEVPRKKEAANPHGERDVPSGAAKEAGIRGEDEKMGSGDRGKTVESGARPIVVVGDAMYPVLLADAARDGHITEDEFSQRYALHKLIEKTMNDPAAP